MEKIHTHYDNLKVTRNAPLEVIRAAYKTLTQKYHPDKHPANADAGRVMELINVSHHVLSDQYQRAEHDRSIAQQEQAIKAPRPNVSQPVKTSLPMAESMSQQRSHYQPAPSHAQSSAQAMRGVVSHVFRNWFLYGFAGLLFWIWATYTPPQPPAGLKPYQASQASIVPAKNAVLEDAIASDGKAAEPAVVAPIKVEPVNEKPRGTTAPNGQPWPVVAGYLDGYEQLHADGLSTVTVDNGQNDSKVFVKLVSFDGAQAYPVRQFFIPAHASFTVTKVDAGSYDVRYRDLRTGGLSRSKAFPLREVHNDQGTQFSNLTMTLYKVINGNMKTYGLSDAEF